MFGTRDVKHLWIRGSAVCVLVLALTLGGSVQGAELGEVEIGDEIPCFKLTAHGSDEEITLSELEGKLVVIDVRCHRCPWVVGADEFYKELVAEYEDHDEVIFIGVDPHADDWTTTEDVVAYNEEAGVTWPVLQGGDQVWVDAVGATRTPEIYIVDNRDADNPMRLVYHGAVSSGGSPGDIGDDYYVADAIEQLLAGGEADPAVTSAWGCTIKR